MPANGFGSQGWGVCGGGAIYFRDGIGAAECRRPFPAVWCLWGSVWCCVVWLWCSVWHSARQSGGQNVALGLHLVDPICNPIFSSIFFRDAFLQLQNFGPPRFGRGNVGISGVRLGLELVQRLPRGWFRSWLDIRSCPGSVLSLPRVGLSSWRGIESGRSPGVAQFLAEGWFDSWVWDVSSRWAQIGSAPGPGLGQPLAPNWVSHWPKFASAPGPKSL